MKVLWTPRAARDLTAVKNYISERNPEAATRVATGIFHQLIELESNPEMGRYGAVPGIREIVFPPWPYIAVYKVRPDSVRILRIRHASRQYP